MKKIKVKVEGIKMLPEYQTEQSSGMDVRALTSHTIVLKPNMVQLIPTGIKMAIPDGYECQIRPRSGLALKHGITVLNTPGTIDADYRGEVGIILINLSDKDFIIKNGDRIAQMVFAPVVKCEWVQGSLDNTERGTGGFGHTGK